jgi:hypothetical protein
MDVAWYERDEVKDKLIVFGRAMQGVAPYEVIIEPDPAKCRGGCCGFDSRRITVNPTAFSVPAQEQYLLTKALLVHEAGHRRHSSPASLPSPVREIANILDDERVERRMCQEFVGIKWLISKLAGRFYEQSRPIDETSDKRNEVVSYFLQLRWATRIGLQVKGGLSPKNQLLWEKVKPFVDEAWQAEGSDIVHGNAARIAEILSLSPKP